jgi:hypothetical protein
MPPHETLLRPDRPFAIYYALIDQLRPQCRLHTPSHHRFCTSESDAGWITLVISPSVSSSFMNAGLITFVFLQNAAERAHLTASCSFAIIVSLLFLVNYKGLTAELESSTQTAQLDVDASWKDARKIPETLFGVFFEVRSCWLFDVQEHRSKNIFQELLQTCVFWLHGKISLSSEVLQNFFNP